MDIIISLSLQLRVPEHRDWQFVQCQQETELGFAPRQSDPESVLSYCFAL